MKLNLLILFILGTTLIANCQTTVSGGNVSGTWTLSGSPYLIQGSIMIPVDSLLTIEQGVTVDFQGHYKFLILGRLLAKGTAVDSIFFTAANNVTGWYGLRFDNTSLSSDTSVFSYCSIQWGIAHGSGNDAYGGGLFVNNFSKVVISSCLVKNNSADFGGGISLLNSNLKISHNTISNNTGGSGGGIYCNASNPVITHNSILNNYAGNAGGGI